MIKTIFDCLMRIDMINNFGVGPEKIMVTAQLYAEDLKDESISDIKRAFDYWRKNRSTWPKLSEILDVIYQVREPERLALPITTQSASTPGTGSLFQKFRAEGRPVEEFVAAKKRFDSEYKNCLEQKKCWPKGKDLENMLDLMFGGGNKRRTFADMCVCD